MTGSVDNVFTHIQGGQCACYSCTASQLAEVIADRGIIMDESIEQAGRIAALEARCRQYEEAFHKAFNQFENITVADTLEIAKERAHQMIGWAYASMPDYAPETHVHPNNGQPLKRLNPDGEENPHAADCQCRACSPKETKGDVDGR